MATKKTIPWTTHATYIFIGLLACGAISLANVPQYYCSVEDKVMPCVFTDGTNLTCYTPFRDDNGNWSVTGDRCQSGRNYGKWVKVETFTKLPAPSIDGKEVEVMKPTIFTGAHIYKTSDGKLYVEGYCYSPMEVLQ